MKRKITQELEKWRSNKDRLPLILGGARQVGKTYVMEEFGKNEFNNYVKVNFDRVDQDIKDLFSDNINPRRIIDFLALKYQMPIEPEKTLLIFDEIQENKRALASLKYFAEEAPEYPLIAAGSLLGVALNEGVSFPVGKVDRLTLFPMDLEEFFWAVGLEGETEAIKNAVKAGETPMFSSSERDYFQQYLAVGGMPRAVKTWIDTKDVLAVETILQNILADYQDDFGKHTTSAEAKRITELWRSIPSQFAKENHKFTYKTIEPGARGRDYGFAFEWLVSAGLATKVALVPHGNKLPLSAYANQEDFKIYVLDVGLLRVLSGLPTDVVIGEDDIWSQFGGAFAEQFVLNQMRAGGVKEAFYWVGGGEALPKGRSKVDFVIANGREIIPIEVKSGLNVKARSLRVYRERYRPDLSIRFSLKGLEYNDGLLNIPLFYSFILPEELSISAKNVGKL